MRILGMDFGEKRIGLALSDVLQITAQGLTTIQRKGTAEDLAQIMQVIAEKEVVKLVVGLPRNMDGSYGPQAEKVKSFIKLLEDCCSLEIVYWDERLTTQAAKRVLLAGDVSRRKRKKVIDQMAAVLILQSYLDNLS